MLIKSFQLYKNHVKNIGLPAAIFLVTLMGFLSGLNLIPQPVTAKSNYPEFLVNQTIEICIKAAPAKTEAACDEKTAEKALNVATYHCDSTDTPRTITNCMKGKAVGYFNDAVDYFNDAVDPKPDSPTKFITALNKVLDKAGGSTSTPKSTAFNEEKLLKAVCDPTTDALCGGQCATNKPDDDCVKCDNDSCGDAAVECKKANCDLIKKYLNPIINIATVSFGLVAAASLIYGGVLYGSSEADPQKTAKAKDRIAKTMFAAIAYMFLYSFIQFLIPGGIF